jgi:sec-independent protein translocase protein TatB
MIGGLSMTEVIIILALALLLLGPDQLPSLARSLGKGLRELRKATDDLKGQFESEIARIDLNEQPSAPKMIAPVPPPADAAKPEASGDAAKPPEPPPNPADDPAAARAAARRAAVKLVTPPGTVAHDSSPAPAPPVEEQKA